MPEEKLLEIAIHQIYDGIVAAHLKLGNTLNAALDLGDSWDRKVEIAPATDAPEKQD